MCHIAYEIHPRGRAPRHSRCISVEFVSLDIGRFLVAAVGEKVGVVVDRLCRNDNVEWWETVPPQEACTRFRVFFPDDD